MLWPVEIFCARSEFDMGIARAAPSWNPDVQGRTTKVIKSDVTRLSPPTTPTTPPLPPIDPDEEFSGGGNLIVGKTDPVNLLTTTSPPIVIPSDIVVDTNDIEAIDKNDDDYKIPSVFVVITDDPLNVAPTRPTPRLIPPPIKQFTPSSPSRPQGRPPEPSIHVARPVITRIKPYGNRDERQRPPPQVFIPKPTFTPRSLNLQEIQNLEDTTTIEPPIVITPQPSTGTTETVRKKMSGQFPTRRPKAAPPPSRPTEFRPVPPEAIFFHGGQFYSRLPERSIRYVPVHYRIPVFRPPPLYNYNYYEPIPVSYLPRGQSRPRRRYRTPPGNIYRNQIQRPYRNSRSLHRGAVK
ncbi:unnamed protein product [Bursaphelenchus xylophilus]|uniref:(pine wood nematode) hypothetical protein n=1 Tax=Bursaphelenchus xylophilus TaxID=6326 RepID=A0A1I7RRC1_BURXY|nr:unnamed protein product [Bursaphelenchus xylophilus]CAG9130930.1 unnamed protein product [Bursaphelenchus xylophilus]